MEQNNGPAIGIDLGTAYTRVCVFEDNNYKVIPDDHGNDQMPSYVAFTDSGVLVGEAARKQELQNPTNTIFDIMRLIGRRYSEPSIRSDMKLWPFKVVPYPEDSDKAGIEVIWKGKVWQFTPEEILSMILTRIKENAETNLRAAVTNAVVAIPVSFNYGQRDAVRCAGIIAGLNLMRLTAAPTAAGLFYCIKKASARSSDTLANMIACYPLFSQDYDMVVLDFGAGTFDVSVLTLRGDACQVRATGGDAHLGGKDIDTQMVKYFVNSLKLKDKKEIESVPEALMKLRMVSENAKISMSSGAIMIPVEIPSLHNDRSWENSITKSKFRELSDKLILCCMDILETCLKDAKIMVDEVIIVGGSTRISKMQFYLRRFFENKDLNLSKHLEMAVSYGASIQAFFLSGQRDPRIRPLYLSDATPFSLGIQTRNGVMSVFIPKNTSIPTRKAKNFQVDNLSNFFVEVYEGEGNLTRENNLLGKFKLNYYSPYGYDVDICFEIDINGTLKVTAQELCTKYEIIINGDNNSSPTIDMSREKVWECLPYKEVHEKGIIKAPTTTISSDSDSPRTQNKMKQESLFSKVTSLKSTTTISTESDSPRTWNKMKQKGLLSKVTSLKKDKPEKEPEEYAIGIDQVTTNATNSIYEFSNLEIEKATNNFDNSLIIGNGGYGVVYKGFLQDKTVAIKVLKNQSSQEDITQFNLELEILNRARHPNIISLIGASREAGALIFEFIPNGSLDTFLTNRESFPRPKLYWKDRIHIASEICSALIFLHSVKPYGIAHGDLKPENILIDSNFLSKLIDFGISRKLQLSNETVTPFHLTEMPKYTPSILLTGRDPRRIRDVVEEAVEKNTLYTIIDDSAGEWPIEEVERLALLGIECTKPRKERSNLANVESTLKEITSRGKERENAIGSHFSNKRNQYYKEQEYAIGIDLGTTYSSVGAWQKNGVMIIDNECGNGLTHSCVALTEAGWLIGDLAIKEQVTTNPSNTIYNVKRLIGRRYSDTTTPYKVIVGNNGGPLISVQYKGADKNFAPEEITSMILAKLKGIADLCLGSNIKNAVVSVPACFTDSQRKAIKDAGFIAGLNVLQLINEPTAAAIAYFLQEVGDGSSSEKNVLIFDLGGGILEVSVFTIFGVVIKLQSVAGDTNLGGENFDDNMVNHFVHQFHEKNKIDMNNNPKSLRRLRTASENAKRVLSTIPSTTIEIDALYDGIDFHTTITKDDFEIINRSLFDQCIKCVEKCLKDAKMDKTHIHDVILVGGSTRIPKVQQLLQEFFDGKELYKGINQDEAITYGASILAAILSGNEGNKKFHGLQIQDVTTVSLGLGSACVVIPKNTVIPARKELICTTSFDNMTEISFDVRSYESACMTDTDGLLANFTLSGILPEPRGHPKINVTFEVDADGILNVEARTETKKENTDDKITVSKKTCCLSAEQIQQMAEKAVGYKAEDEEHNIR